MLETPLILAECILKNLHLLHDGHRNFYFLIEIYGFVTMNAGQMTLIQNLLGHDAW